VTGRVVASAAAAVIVVAAVAPAAATAAVTAPSREHGATTAQIVASARPGRGRRIARVATVTSWSHHAQRLLVIGAARRHGRDWLEVLLPARPNGTRGWIPRDKALLEPTPYWIELELGPRRLSVYRSGRRVRRFRAVIGAPSTPTPRGLAAIYERNAQPDPRGFIGPWALSLTAHSNVLESYGGGPGRVAIHGREGASLRDPLGSARSHGCIRITSRAVTWLARHVDAGTPVRIRG
jgi:lipoprotein-anchoring transpeptidase ErfK/SrfK